MLKKNSTKPALVMVTVSDMNGFPSQVTNNLGVNFVSLTMQVINSQISSMVLSSVTDWVLNFKSKVEYSANTKLTVTLPSQVKLPTTLACKIGSADATCSNIGSGSPL